MISKKEDIETYSQRITRDMRMGNLSGVGGTTVFPKTDDGVTQQEASVTGIPVSKKMAGTTVPPKQAPRADRMDKSKKLMPAPGWITRKAGQKAGDMTTENLEFKVKIKGIV